MKFTPPTADDVRNTRLAAGLTQKECAERFGYALRSWQQKEDAGKGNRSLTVGEFELLLLVAGQHPSYTLIPKNQPAKL